MASDFPNHTFVTFFSSIQIDDGRRMSEPQLNSLICSSKAPTELLRIPDYNLDTNQDKEIKIGINLKMNYTHSEILNYISRNFSQLCGEPDIGLL